MYVKLAAEGKSNYTIAEQLGVDEASVRRGLRAAGYKRHLIPLDVEERFMFELDSPLTLTDESVMVTADWHIPLYDPVYANEMIERARHEGIKTLIVGGDFFNFDSISRFDEKQADAGLERELNEGISVMATLTETFDKIIYVWGNHDARLHTRLGYKLAFKNTMQLIFRALDREQYGKLYFTNLDHVWVEQEDERWYICHPNNYTRIPLSGARVLATKLNANVITAHSHHCAVGYSIDGARVACEIGGLFDKDKTAYLQRTTTFPTWTQGYAWLKNGKLHVASPGWSTA